MSPPQGQQGDANGDGFRDGFADEFVEIQNQGEATVDISGWILTDDDTDGDRAFVFPSGTMLAQGDLAVVFGGGTQQS
jgi:hypothetical protein